MRYYFISMTAVCGFVLMGLFGLIRPTAADDGCGGQIPTAVNTALEDDLFALINDVRTEAGDSALQLNEGLQNAARYYASDITADDYFDLSVAEGYNIYDRVEGELVFACSFSTMLQTFYFQIGQIALITIPGGATADEVFASMETYDLLGQLTDPTKTIMGIGYAEYADGRPFWLVLATNAPIPTETPTPSPTHTPTNTPTITHTPDPSVTPMPTHTPTPSPTVTPTTPPTETPNSNDAIACNPSGGRGGEYEGEGGGSFSPEAFGPLNLPATIIISPDYDPDQPVYLAFFLHGDEGAYDAHQTNSNAVNQFIQERGWIYVAPRAPEYPRTSPSDLPPWYPWYGGDLSFGNGRAEENAQMLRSILNQMFADYNVCRNVIFGATVSGGSYFYDGYFFPTAGDEYPAFVNLHCGSSGLTEPGTGETNVRYERLVAHSASAQIRQRFAMSYVIGTEDVSIEAYGLYDRVLATSAVYDALGFDVAVEELQGIAHCDDSQYGSNLINDRMIQFWSETADAITVSFSDTPLAVTMQQPKTAATGIHALLLILLTLALTTLTLAHQWQD